MSIAHRPAYVDRELIVAHTLADMGMPVFLCRLDEDGSPYLPKQWEQSAAGDVSHSAIDRWRPGMGLCGVCGIAFDVVDVDPRNGGLDSLPGLLGELEADAPEIFGIARTASHGIHFYITTQNIRKGKLATGIDYQAGDNMGEGRGFVFLPPTVRPSKMPGDKGTARAYSWYMPVHPQATPWAQSLSPSIANIIARQDRPDGESTGRLSAEELQRLVLSAETGAQWDALLALVQEYQFQGMTREQVKTIMRDFLPTVPLFEADNPWWPARGRNPDKWINSMLRKEGTFVPDARPEELAGIESVVPRHASLTLPGEDKFWTSRTVLHQIWKWAKARRAAPWAVLGEAMAEAVCHTPPGFRLPPIVGGDGTLNMLIAIVGKSGAGKNSASQAARAAFQWHGILGLIEDRVVRVPLGSGEGLAHTFGRNIRDKESGRMELVRSTLSAVVTIPEIDTFAAINSRSGATISPELRKLYSGEDLGFNWADDNKRVIIPEHSYRACVIAGVQPGRGSIILDDVDGGFAQRWLWIPATDPEAQDERLGDPLVIEWSPPGSIDSLESMDEKLVMKVCESAYDEADRERVKALRGDSDDIEAHSMYTRIKVAAALALLDGSADLRESDWALSSFVMKMSDMQREEVSGHLRRKMEDANRSRGRMDGIRRNVADKTDATETRTRLAKRVMDRLDKDTWMTISYIKNNVVSSLERPFVEETMARLAELERVESMESPSRNGSGKPTVKYRKKGRPKA
jgi:Bifunctional DNA primase/polymerase, N-terminal